MNKFKKGDIVVIIDNTDCIKFGRPNGQDLVVKQDVPIGLVCEITVTRSLEITLEKTLDGYFFNELYTSFLILRHATNREKFLYHILGPYASEEENRKELIDGTFGI